MSFLASYLKVGCEAFFRITNLTVLPCKGGNVLNAFSSPWALTGQVRPKFQDARMLKDFKRREMIRELYPKRLRLNAIRRNTILPKELQEIADTEIRAEPKGSSIIWIHRRCYLTSRKRSVSFRWRLSRIMFRDLADYNKLSGVTRAVW